MLPNLLKSLSLTAALLLLPPTVVSWAQVDAGLMAKANDLEETTTYLASEKATEVSLALAPPEPKGGPGITLIFRARYNGRNVDPDRLAGVVVRVHYRVHSDDRVRAFQALGNSHRLHMDLDSQGGEGITLDFFPTNWGYFGFSAAGDEIPVAFFGMTVEDLRALSMAKSVTGNVLWTDFELTPPELDALRAFARRVAPPPARRGR